MREAQATRLDLRRLGDEDTRSLLRARYGLSGDDEARLVAHLRAHAEGNPFYAGELLRALEEDDVLAPQSDAWALGDLAGARVPPLLRQVIDARVDRLGEEVRALQSVAAVVGQEVPLDLWATVGEVPEEALLAPVERAIEAGLLAEAGGGAAVRFTHALIREALYEGLAPIRRRLLHRRTGNALAARPTPDPDAVAYHFRQAGDPRAADWLIRAGDRAQRAYALLSAAARFEAALALLERGDPPTRDRGWLLLRLARVRRLDAPAETIRYLDEALGVAAVLRDATLAAYARAVRGLHRCNAGAVWGGIAELRAGVAALDALAPVDRARLPALQDFVGDPRDDHPYRGTLALLLAGSGRYDEGRALAERVIADTPATPLAGGVGASFIADAYFGLGQAQAALGHPAAARHAFARAYEHYRAVGHRYNAGSSLVGDLIMVAVPYEADNPAELRRLAGLAAEEVAQSRSAHAGHPQRLVYLPILVLEGHWAEARAVAVAARPFRLEIAIRALAALAPAQGDSDLGWGLVRDWLPAGPGTSPEEARFSNFAAAPSLQRLAATLALEADDLPLARGWLAAHDRWLAWSGAVRESAEGHLGWAAYRRAAGDLGTARAHAEAALAHATKPRQPLAVLAAHRTLGELDTAQGRHAASSSHLDAALALADACAAPYERALTLLARAELYHAAWDNTTAAAALGEVRAILAPLAARPALARAAALAAHLAAPPPPTAPAALPFGLTAREAEILRLVAKGMTDAQIGERLFVSHHTVGTHLRAVYGKLGVSSRAAATRLALEHGLA